MNLLDFENNKKFQNFANSMFQYSMIPAINKPIRVTKNTVTAIDNIITNLHFNKEFKRDIVKTNILDHFPAIFAIKLKEVDIRKD